MFNLNNVLRIANLCTAVTVGILIAYIELSVRTLAIVAGFTAFLFMFYGYLETKEIDRYRTIAEQVAAEQGFDLSSLDKKDRGE